MSTYIKSIDVDTDIIVLSNQFIFSKTDNFLNETKHIINVDFFVSKIAESIAKNFDNLEKCLNNKQFFKIETEDKAFCFLVKISTNHDEAVKNVRQEVRQYHCHRGYEETALKHRVIPSVKGIVHQLPQALPAEQSLQLYSSSQYGSQVQSYDGRHGYHGVGDSVME